MTLKISVITVTLNAGKYLKECLSSVNSQSDSLYEHIIVDGGSTDSTLDIIKKYAENDPRVRWISEPDGGIADAMNKGVRLSSGDIVAHLHSDDFYPHPHVLATVMESFSRHPDELWLTAGATFVSGDGSYLRDIRVRRYSFRRLVRGNIILHPSTFIKCDLFNVLGGFDPKLLFCMDYDLFLRLGSVRPPLIVDKQLSCFRITNGSCSVSHSEEAYAEELRVRMGYLHGKGRSTLYYRFDYQFKRILNRLFYKRLLLLARNRSSSGMLCQR